MLCFVALKNRAGPLTALTAVFEDISGFLKDSSNRQDEKYILSVIH